MTTERSPLEGRRVLLGVTGGIAAYKACILVRLLRLQGASVRVVMTRSAERFVGPATFAALSDHRVYTDLFEEPGVVLHVRLAHEADIAVVAPATANVDRQARAGHRRRPAHVDVARGHLPARPCAGDAHRDVGAPRDAGQRRTRSPREGLASSDRPTDRWPRATRGPAA